MTDDLPRRPLFVRLTPPRDAGPAVENPHLTDEQKRELDLAFTNGQMVARQGAACAKFETEGDKPPRTGRRKKLIVPRYDIAAQVEALGADSLLPPGDGVALSSMVHPSSKLVGVRLSADLLARLDAKRGDVGRQEFIRGILEFALPKLKAVP